MKKNTQEEIVMHRKMADVCRYEMTLLIDKADIYFSKVEKARSYVSFHWQDSYELIYVLKGVQEILFSDNAVTLRQSECAIVNPGVLHAARSSEDNEFILVLLPLAFVRKYTSGDKLFRFDLFDHSDDPQTLQRQSELRDVLDRMYELSTLRPYGFELRFNSLVFELLFQLLQNFSTELPGTAKKLSAKQQKPLADIINYVYANYSNAISIEEAADVCHLQPQYFCRFFRKHMGKTFLEFVNETRLYFVYIDLTKTDFPIHQIAERNGFSNYDTFLKTFRSKFQCTPSEFRSLPPAKSSAQFHWWSVCKTETP